MSSAVSPSKNASEYLNYSVEVDGTAVESKFSIVGITTVSAINDIPKAKIILNDGDMADGKFVASDGDAFKPGSTIKISSGYGSSVTNIFSGIIIGQSVVINAHVHSQLIIECRDKALAMTINRNNVIYQKQADSDVISTLVGNTSGLSVTVKSTQTKYNQLVQFNATDWDFLMYRTQANGFVTTIDDGKLTIQPPALSKDPELVVTWGVDLIDFRADLDARYQFKTVEATGWDMSTQKIVTKSADAVAGNTQGNSTESDLSKVLGVSSHNLETSACLQADELEGWAKSKQLQMALARIRGCMTFKGNAKALPGTQIEVKSVGARFSGNVYVSEVEHKLQHNSWTTKVKFGLSPHFSGDRLSQYSTTAVVPPAEGMQIGVVQKLTGDPATENRILVQIPVLQNKADGVWARLSSFYASNGVGGFFIPEVGDEVVVGYINNDPNNAIIMGSLYSSKNTPPYEIDKDNSTKGLLTKNKLSLEFDDKNKVITIVTPGKNTVIISDKDKSITIKDQSGNEIDLTKDGIDIKCAKTLKISASDDLKLSAKNISIEAKQNVSIQGKTIKQKADQTLSAEANSQIKISSSGTASLKGSTVNINQP